MLDKIKNDLNQALKNKDEMKVSVLRMLVAEIHNKQINNKSDEISDDEIIKTIRQQVKKIKESIVAYKQGKRDDLVKKESQELDILNKYLPQEMAPDELEKVIKGIIDSVKPQGPQDFGKVMNEAMKQLSGRVDGSKVSEVVKRLI